MEIGCSYVTCIITPDIIKLIRKENSPKDMKERPLNDSLFMFVC